MRLFLINAAINHEAFNLGNGDGFYVLEVMKGSEYIANNDIQYQVDGRRDGDPAVLVADTELGLVIDDLPSAGLMGVWDHFDENSNMAENVSTHYVNLPHYIRLKESPKLTIDKQHNDISWFDLSEVAIKDSFHKYMQSYASWLINEYEK